MTAVQAVSMTLGAVLLKLAAGKIVPVITSEISSIKGVTKDLLELRDIHETISICLERGIDGDPSLSLATKLKNVADDIDDLLNEVQHAEIKKIDSDGEKYAIVDCFPATKPKSFKSRIKIAHRIKAIKKTYAVILKQKCDTNIILKNPLEPHVVVQGMRAGELSFLSNVEQQKIHGKDQGEDANKCTLSDSDEGMDGWIIVTRKAET
jgi:hypothetical protein